MIQFNLLPDVKKEYIKAKRTRRLITSVSLITSVGAVVLTGFLFFFVQVAQKSNIDDLSSDINRAINSINQTQDLDKILTIQQQNRSIPELHRNNPYTSRLFDFLSITTPASVTISSVQLDVADSTLTIEGAAVDLASINQYVDTLTFATFTAGEDITDGKPFSDINTELGRSESSATYRTTMSFDPILFDNTQDVALVVPNQVTTRSSLGTPSIDVFQAQPEEETQ